ncbi:MAG: tRNA pseudouridine(13) synthase TruD, partial [Halobacteria archaeon]|nr:tRNA pseudouridine(13) synthase TruD [Halobacteria archaeon]
QLFTVAGVSEEEIEGVDIDGAEIEFVGRSHHPIRLGDLRANEFEVVLRSVEDTDGIDEVTDEIDEFGGVPNLFGSQRFGSRRPITHRVGEAVLADDYERAVREYLVTSFPDEPRGTREARRRLDDGWGDEEEYADALSYYPEHLGYERALLNSLVENADGEAGDDTTDDYREALDALPRNLKRLFVNAAQSRLFNLVLRARYDEGMEFDRSYPGDVVCFVDDAGYPDTDELQEVTESNAESVNRHVGRGRAYVTAPLLGSESEFSGGRQGEIERGVLSRAAFELDDFDRDDEYAAEGTRRPVLVRPDIEHETDGDDARFEFTLPKGSYATVVLREYLKDDHVA